jgi:hypothetical protein
MTPATERLETVIVDAGQGSRSATTWPNGIDAP